MRRAYSVSFFHNSIKLGRKTKQPILLLEQFLLLKRSWHGLLVPGLEVTLHAKFDANLMNGISVTAFATKSGVKTNADFTSFNLYRVSDADWTETFIASALADVSVDGRATAYFSQSTLTSSNELSGKETYAIEVTGNRRRAKLRKKMYFNHLGVFDNLNRAKYAIDGLEILKVDE